MRRNPQLCQGQQRPHTSRSEHADATLKNDGFLKSPNSALRCIPRHGDVLYVRLIPRNLRALNLDLFTLPSKSDFLRELAQKAFVHTYPKATYLT